MSWFSDNCLKHKKDYSSVQCVCVWPERNPSMMFSAGDEGREKGAIGVGGKKCYYESSELLNRRNRLVEEWKKAYLLNEQVFDRVRSAVFGYVVVKQVSGVLGGIGIAELQTSGLVCTAGIEDIVSLPEMSSPLKEFCADFIRYRSPIIIGFAGSNCDYQSLVIERQLRSIEGASVVSAEAVKNAYRITVAKHDSVRDFLSASVFMAGSKRRK